MTETTKPTPTHLIVFETAAPPAIRMAWHVIAPADGVGAAPTVEEYVADRGATWRRTADGWRWCGQETPFGLRGTVAVQRRLEVAMYAQMGDGDGC